MAKKALPELQKLLDNERKLEAESARRSKGPQFSCGTHPFIRQPTYREKLENTLHKIISG